MAQRLMVLVVSMFTLFSSNAVAQALQVYFVNGIQNTPRSAERSRVRIEQILSASENHVTARKQFSVELIYNPTGFGSSGKTEWLTCELCQELKELFVLKAAEERYASNFQRLLVPHNASAVVDQIAAQQIKNQYVDTLVPSGISLTVTELSMLGTRQTVDKLLAKIRAGRAIIVGHSQGNLVANLAYASLAAEVGQDAAKLVRIVNIANTSRFAVSQLDLTHANDSALFAVKAPPDDYSLQTLPSRKGWSRDNPPCGSSTCDFQLSTATVAGVAFTSLFNHTMTGTYLSDIEATVTDHQGVALTQGSNRFRDRFEDFVYTAAASLETANPPPPIGVVKLARTGQTLCYSSDGSTIPCAGSGQDGDLRIGKLWPSPRFVVNGDCVDDRLTGLTWGRNANRTLFAASWLQSLIHANDLELCGQTDWRSPNVSELESLFHSGTDDNIGWLTSAGFENVRGANTYWSSTTFPSASLSAFDVLLSSGLTSYTSYNTPTNTWHVRGASVGDGAIAKTGQTISIAPGDDGSIQAGVAWPNPRFAVTGDCVIDQLTGLVWPTNASALGNAHTWQSALDAVKTASLCGRSGWRLPNRQEMLSLLDRGRTNPALPVSLTVVGVQGVYWTSTTAISVLPSTAWGVSVEDGRIAAYGKASLLAVWPVATAQ